MDAVVETMDSELDMFGAERGKIPLIFQELFERVLTEKNTKQNAGIDNFTMGFEMYGSALKLDEFVWNDGAISKKMKKLVAVAIAASLRDQHAIQAHMKAAHKLGATSEEIDETLRVAFLLAGMPAYVAGKITQHNVTDE